MSDARPLPSQTTTGTGGVSRRYSKTIEITLGPPSTMSATTGTPWPIPALKKEKKRKKREKNTKPANQRNKKRNKKHKLKLLSMGEVTTYEGLTYGAKIYRKPFSRIFPLESPLDSALSPQLPAFWGFKALMTIPQRGGVEWGGWERNWLVEEVLGQQPKDWKLNAILSKSHMDPTVSFLYEKWGVKKMPPPWSHHSAKKMPKWFFLLKTTKISWGHILTCSIN